MENGNYSDTETDDVYVINGETFQVFYVKGVEFEGVRYFTAPNDGSMPSVIPEISDDEDDEKIKPILYTGMIPVKWNSDRNEWEKVKKPNSDIWYDYDSGMFANVKLQDGSMYVWIPLTNSTGFWVGKYEASENTAGKLVVIKNGTIWTNSNTIDAKCKSLCLEPSTGLNNSEVNSLLINSSQKSTVANLVNSKSNNSNYSVMKGVSNTKITKTGDLVYRPIIIGESSDFAKVIPTLSYWKNEIRETREGNIPIPNGYYYVGGTKDSELYISNNEDDENIGSSAISNAKGKIYKWIMTNDNYANTNIATSIAKYGGFYVDYRYNDNNESYVITSNTNETYLNVLTDFNIAVCRRVGFWNPQDLCYFRDDVNDGDTFENITVYLHDDIDLSTVCSSQNGSWDPIGNYQINSSTKKEIYFSGVFEGNNKSIDNLYINEKQKMGSGLFGASNGTIKNLSVSGSVSGVRHVAGIVAVNNGGTLDNCINLCTVLSSGSDSCSQTGGICGCCWNDGSTKNCINNGYIECNEMQVGGICGYLNNSVIENCINNANIVSKKTHVGGICGMNAYGEGKSATVSMCYNKGKITGSSTVGGIVGMNGSQKRKWKCK